MNASMLSRMTLLLPALITNWFVEEKHTVQQRREEKNSRRPSQSIEG